MPGTRRPPHPTACPDRVRSSRLVACRMHAAKIAEQRKGQSSQPREHVVEVPVVTALTTP